MSTSRRIGCDAAPMNNTDIPMIEKSAFEIIFCSILSQSVSRWFVFSWCFSLPITVISPTCQDAYRYWANSCYGGNSNFCINIVLCDVLGFWLYRQFILRLKNLKTIHAALSRTPLSVTRIAVVTNCMSLSQQWGWENFSLMAPSQIWI